MEPPSLSLFPGNNPSPSLRSQLVASRKGKYDPIPMRANKRRHKFTWFLILGRNNSSWYSVSFQVSAARINGQYLFDKNNNKIKITSIHGYFLIHVCGRDNAGLLVAPKSLENTMRSSIGEIISKMWDLHCHERLLAKRKLGSSEDERDGRQILERITDGGLPPTQSESSNSSSE